MEEYITANIKLNKKANYIKDSNLFLIVLNRKHEVVLPNIKMMQIDIDFVIRIDLINGPFGNLDLVPHQKFKIQYKSIEIGEGEVIDVCGYNFKGFPLFIEYLLDHQNGYREQSMLKLNLFTNSIRNDKVIFKNFIIELSRVLECLSYHSQEHGITTPTSWLNSQIKDLLYNYYVPLISIDNPDFDDLKYYCLFVRDKDWRKNLKMIPLCEKLLVACSVRDIIKITKKDKVNFTN